MLNDKQPILGRALKFNDEAISSGDPRFKIGVEDLDFLRMVGRELQRALQILKRCFRPIPHTGSANFNGDI